MFSTVSMWFNFAQQNYLSKSMRRNKSIIPVLQLTTFNSAKNLAGDVNHNSFYIFVASIKIYGII